MTDQNIDPFTNDVSPWDEAPRNDEPTTQGAPATQPASVGGPNPFKIGMTLKAASGYDAEWLTPTVYGATAVETAESAKALLEAMRDAGLIELVSNAAQYTRGQFKGGNNQPAGSKPSFNRNSGQVQYGNQDQPANNGPARPANVPEYFEYKEGTSKAGKHYKAWFPPKGSNESPIWA